MALVCRHHWMIQYKNKYFLVLYFRVSQKQERRINVTRTHCVCNTVEKQCMDVRVRARLAGVCEPVCA
jgi:hypothetical protein